ncbi:MAG: VOC family protein [Candidatus Andersenbacteria bacterium]
MDFPETKAELTHILVVKDTAESKNWYTNILGASLHGEYRSSVVLKFLNNWLLLVEEGGPTEDKPDVRMQVSEDHTKVDHSFTIRVADCQGVYKELMRRGAIFLTEPVDHEYEIRAFFRDPDGHLFEISELKK